MHLTTRSPLSFFLLTFALTIPFYFFGGRPLPIPMKLPISALAAFNPMIAAAILTWRQSGSQGVKALFRRVRDYKKIKNKAWYLPILLLNPLVFLLAYAVVRWAGRPLPEEPQAPWLLAPALFALFFVFGIGEELGWMGYAADPLLERRGVLQAGLFLGVVWAAIHLVPDLQNQQPAGWIFWHRLGTVVLRLLIVWIYAQTGRSVFSSILIHAMNNLSWTLFPNYGSHYDPMATTLLLLPATALLILATRPKATPRNEPSSPPSS